MGYSSDDWSQNIQEYRLSGKIFKLKELGPSRWTGLLGAGFSVYLLFKE
jgi:hypothetical protein